LTQEGNYLLIAFPRTDGCSQVRNTTLKTGRDYGCNEVTL